MHITHYLFIISKISLPNCRRQLLRRLWPGCFYSDGKRVLKRWNEYAIRCTHSSGHLIKSPDTSAIGGNVFCYRSIRVHGTMDADSYIFRLLRFSTNIVVACPIQNPLTLEIKILNVNFQNFWLIARLIALSISANGHRLRIAFPIGFFSREQLRSAATVNWWPLSDTRYGPSRFLIHVKPKFPIDFNILRDQ
jgi:hypothetical protein